MYFKTADVEGLRLFYREAGDPSKPTIALLHGFPSSSYLFHDLIPRLADQFHVIAPDYPGMLVLYCALSRKREGGRGAARAFDRAVWRWPLAVALDAG